MRRLRRASAVALLLAISLLYPLLAPTAHRIDEAHLELVRVGMTQAEVEAIFGVPAGAYDWAVDDRITFFPPAVSLIVRGRPNPTIVYTERRLSLADSFFITGEVYTVAPTRDWISRHGVFQITLDADGRVASKANLGPTRIEYPWQRWWRQLRGT